MLPAMTALTGMLSVLIRPCTCSRMVHHGIVHHEQQDEQDRSAVRTLTCSIVVISSVLGAVSMSVIVASRHVTGIQVTIAGHPLKGHSPFMGITAEGHSPSA